MLSHHLGLRITEAQRARWASLVATSADLAGLPVDPEFRSAFVAYVEWGTRLAMANSAEGAGPPPAAPVPRWGWGEAPPHCPDPRRGTACRSRHGHDRPPGPVRSGGRGYRGRAPRRTGGPTWTSPANG